MGLIVRSYLTLGLLLIFKIIQLSADFKKYVNGFVAV